MKKNIVNVFGNNAVIHHSPPLFSTKVKWAAGIGLSVCLLITASWFIYATGNISNAELFNRYYEAPRHINKMLASANGHNEAVRLFMQAEKAIDIEDYHRALELYDKILNELDSDMLAEEATWYKGLCLLKVNAHKDVIYNHFVDILKYNGRYRGKTLKILQHKFSDDPSSQK